MGKCPARIGGSPLLNEMPLPNRRRLLLGLFVCTTTFAVMILAAEGLLRFLPVATGLSANPVTNTDPVLRYAPNREFVYSRGWDLHGANRGHTNNLGWVSEQTYDSTSTSPLLAIVGDSYVEAQMIPYAESVTGRLAQRVGNVGRVYSFAISGAPLSQYLAQANYARQHFRPAGLVVTVVGNDFDESLQRNIPGRGFHAFVPAADGSLVLKNELYAPGGIRSKLRHSALARYLVVNLHLLELRAVIEALRTPQGAYVGNTVAAADPDRLRDSKRVIDTFLRLLPATSGLAPDRIAFLVDAERNAIYHPSERTDRAYYTQMRSYFMDSARQRGFEVVDTQARFASRYAREGERFDFPDDAHWNSIGHDEAARAVIESALFQKVFTFTPSP
jgi:hypothetical protein